ncbi:hypothetical protein ERD95_18700 [Enterobacteriaceae bacterium ML5]|nr:hypothetical protein ERD95_18700 [Enterobacteriaceae bacterium ML5]
MPDIKLSCEKCTSERFVASSNYPSSDMVSSLVCALCHHPVDVSSVVTFRDTPYIALVPPLPDHLFHHVESSRQG